MDKVKVFMQVDMSEKDATLSLLMIKGLGSKRFFRLKEAFGSALDVWRHASKKGLKDLVPDSVANAILKGPDEKGLKRLKETCKRKGFWLLFYNDPDYPPSLRHIHDPPAVLFGAGNRKVLSSRCVAIVGSRKSSTYGQRICASIAKSLSEAGLTIVSGLALGIDACAHRAAVDSGGLTIAVKGCGLDVKYPMRNAFLAEKIAENGAVISEFFPEVVAEPGNFPARNRIISGLSLGVVVVEAGVKSGSLITAYLALDQGREVMAVPGSVFSYGSKGCHKLIKEGAGLVESAKDVLETLGLDQWDANTNSRDKAQKMPVISGETGKVIDKLGADPQHIDEIAVKCSMPASKVASILTELELKDLVTCWGSGMYSLIKSNE